MTRAITDEQWWEYHQNGFLRLGKLLSGTELAGLQERMDEIMLGTAPLDYSRIFMQLDSNTGAYSDVPGGGRGFQGPSLAYRKIQDLEYDERFLAYMQLPIFREICAEVYGAHASVSVFRAMFMNKPARLGTVLPWHQDGGDQWGLDRDPLVTIWTALDPATLANGCVEVLPGTHRLGLLSDHGHTITPEQEREHCPEAKVVALEAEPGEVLLLHNWMLHRSGVNQTDIPRRGFSACYMDARTRSHRGEGYNVLFGKGAMRVEDLVAVA